MQRSSRDTAFSLLTNPETRMSSLKLVADILKHTIFALIIHNQIFYLNNFFNLNERKKIALYLV